MKEAFYAYGQGFIQNTKGWHRLIHRKSVLKQKKKELPNYLSLQPRTRIQVLIVFLPVIMLKVIFLMSYSLNISENGYNYYTNMLLPERAMLVHASGYPYFVDAKPALFELIYVASQHFFDSFCLAMLYKVVVRYFGLGVAVLSLYFSGLSVFI